MSLLMDYAGISANVNDAISTLIFSLIFYILAGCMIKRIKRALKELEGLSSEEEKEIKRRYIKDDEWVFTLFKWTGGILMVYALWLLNEEYRIDLLLIGVFK